MASHPRLDADPFLNELYNEKTYTMTGLEWIEETNGLKDLLKRHYPTLARRSLPNSSLSNRTARRMKLCQFGIRLPKMAGSIPTFNPFEPT